MIATKCRPTPRLGGVLARVHAIRRQSCCIHARFQHWRSGGAPNGGQMKMPAAREATIPSEKAPPLFCPNSSGVQAKGPDDLSSITRRVRELTRSQHRTFVPVMSLITRVGATTEAGFEKRSKNVLLCIPGFQK